MRQKQFLLAAEQIEPIAIGFGACIATDKITVEGLPVRYMYREEPDNALDSGWRFLSGYESDEYMEDADHHAIYEVNTIANYDRTIIPYLAAPVGSAFEKVPDASDFTPVAAEE